MASAALASGNVITRYAGKSEVLGPPLAGPALESELNYPEGVAVDSRGNVYIADTENNLVEKVTPGGILSIIAGTGTFGAPTPGPATSSRLAQPFGVAVDSSGNIYISDTENDVVEKVTPGGTLSIIASNLNRPNGVAVDSSGNVYIADTYNNLVKKVTSSGALTVVAGNGTPNKPTPGPATQSPLKAPEGVAIDSSGNLYIADTFNNVVEKVTPSGMLSIFAGTGIGEHPSAGAFPPSAGVSATTSPLFHPENLAFDSAGNLYIADASNDLVERVTALGILSVIAGRGSPGAAPTYNGPPLSSHLNFPDGVAVDSSGVVYIADEVNGTIDRVGPETAAPPTITTIVPGNGTATISFLSPVSAGTSPISGYEVSTDGGVTWRPLSTTGGLEGALQGTISGLSDGSTYLVLLRALNGSGAGAPSAGASVTVPVPPSAAVTSAAVPALASCHSRRAITLHWRMPHGARAGKVTVTVNRKLYRILPAGARQVTVSLAGIPGPAAVSVQVNTRQGRGLTLRTERALHVCTTPRKSPRRPPSLYLAP